MSLEDQLSGWTGPSSDTEKDKQDRAERMIRQAIDAHEPFNGYSLKVYAKGSYANNTNVRADWKRGCYPFVWVEKTIKII